METKQHSTQSGYDPSMAGRRAECDGGMPIAGGATATREEYTGTLSGEYVDHGDPPWRWYRMIALTRAPEGYAWDSVWCESGNVFLIDRNE